MSEQDEWSRLIETKKIAEYWIARCSRAEKQLEQREWISVKDRLPEEHENVLTYGARPSYDVVYINRLIDKKNGEWLYDGVTHWMPLPPLPEEDEDVQF